MSAQRPRFSVIIPARNEEAYVGAIIKSVQMQDFAQKSEIIVVNNASVDQTAVVAQKAGAAVVDEPIGGLPRAREAGRCAAHGEILVYVDADMRLPKDYLSKIDKAFIDNPEAIAVTNPFTFYDGTLLQKAIIFSFTRVVYPGQNLLLQILGKSRQVLGGNFAITSDVLQRVGGFRVDSKFQGEDLTISKQIAPHGPVIFLPKLYTQTSARRFATRGSLSTAGYYVRNFFSVLLLPKHRKKRGLSVAIRFAVLIAVLLAAAWLIGLLTFINQHMGVSIAFAVVAIIGVAVYSLTFPKSQIYGEVLSNFNTNEKIVALTFDDGPRQGSTNKVLEILKAEGLTATFFLVGKNAKAQALITKQIKDEGHELGNHTYSHQWRTPFLSPKRLTQHLKHAQQCIDNALDQPMSPRLFRPPHGWRSPWMLSTLEREGYKTITWDISLDFLPGVSAETIRERYLRKVKPGSIFLFHDSIWERPHDNRDNLLEALPHIIHELKRRGYKFVTISQMLM